MAVTASQSNIELTHAALPVTCYPPAAFQFVCEGLGYTTERANCLQHGAGSNGGMVGGDMAGGGMAGGGMAGGGFASGLGGDPHADPAESGGLSGGLAGGLSGGPAGAGGLGGSLPMPEIRHVTGQQLCLGLREYAIERFGMLAPCVLRHWNISRTEDFGRIVYALIEAGRLDKSADDSIEDFHAVFDFDEAFSPAVLGARIAPR